MRFHVNGAISEGYVGPGDFTLKMGANEITFKGDEIMEFDKDGGISNGLLATDAVLSVGKNSMIFRGGSGNPISTYPNGNIRTGRLSRDCSLLLGDRSISFRKDSNISFYEDGSIESGMVNDELAIHVKGRNKILEKQKLYFRDDGSIETIYEGYTYKKVHEL